MVIVSIPVCTIGNGHWLALLNVVDGKNGKGIGAVDRRDLNPLRRLVGMQQLIAKTYMRVGLAVVVGEAEGS